MDEVLEDLQRERQEQAATQQQQQQPEEQPRAWPQAAPLAQRSPRFRPPPVPEPALRCLNTLRVCGAVTVAACASLAPEGLAATELVAVLVTYFLFVPNALLTRRRPADWSYSFSGEGRAGLWNPKKIQTQFKSVLLAHAHGLGARFQRPYLWAAAGFACIGLPLAGAKAWALRRSAWPRRAWPPFLALYLLAAALSLAHLAAARLLAARARRRWEAGLGGFGFPWGEGEGARPLAGRAAAGAAPEGDEDEGPDLPAEVFAEPDSRWIECGGLRVHAKEAAPAGGLPPGAGAAGVLLLHGFGGGTFAWRHVMQPLADACGARVVAIDRPGFGLTSRPCVDHATSSGANPYTLKAQAALVLQACAALGLRRVVLVGHADGALLALMAAAAACRGGAAAPAARGGEPGGARAAAGAAGSRGIAVPPQVVMTEGLQGSDSLDWSWMGSQGDRDSVLTRLLRGDWPGSFGAARHSLHGASAGSAPHSHRGPASLVGDERAGGRAPATAPADASPQLQALPEGEEPQPDLEVGEVGESWGGDVNELSAGAAAAVAGGGEAPAQGALAAESSQVLLVPEEVPGIGVYDNASFLSSASTSTAPGQARHGDGGGGSLTLQQLLDNPSYRFSSADREGLFSTAEREGGWASAGREGPFASAGGEAAAFGEQGGLAAAGAPEGGGAGGEDAPPAPAPVPAASSWHWKPPDAQQEQQQAGTGAGPAADAAPAERCQQWELPAVAGLVLLSPDLSGQVAPRYMRVLAHTRLGCRLLRSLLRTHVGEVGNARAWGDPSLLAASVIQLYRRPLHIAGCPPHTLSWDAALTEVCRAPNDVHGEERGRLLAAAAAARLPTLVATGERDGIAPPAAAARVAGRLGPAAPRFAVLPSVGHLPMEERPHVLLECLSSFVRDVQRQAR
eukprot:scaffold3.g6244.t1